LDEAQKPNNAPAPGGTVETVGPGQAISILGKKVVGQDGKAILGPVIDILVDAEGKPRAAVIDFGGFLGVGSRHVAIDWNSLKFRLDDRDAPVQLDLDPAAIKAAPEYKEVDANTEVVEPALSPPAPLPVVAPLSELPIEQVELPALPGTHSVKNAGQ
jgi:PRC-barrel domain